MRQFSVRKGNPAGNAAESLLIHVLKRTTAEQAHKAGNFIVTEKCSLFIRVKCCDK
jgi:hypothetical protein